MEKACWNGKIIYAVDIATDYELETKIRLAGGHAELFCPDENCLARALRYCHGDKKRPYFAHRNNSCCDYAQYDSSVTENIKEIKEKLYTHFISIGYYVELDVKWLPHHYAPLGIKINNENIAVELVTKRVSVSKIHALRDEYDAAHITVKFIIIGDEIDSQDEENMNFIERFALNETNNQDFILIESNGEKVHQYRFDTKDYTFEEYSFCREYPNVYKVSGELKELVYENHGFALKEFSKAYNEWIAEKQQQFDNEREKILSLRKNYYAKLNAQKKIEATNNKTIPNKQNGFVIKQETKPKNPIKTFETNLQKPLSELRHLEEISVSKRQVSIDMVTWDKEKIRTAVERICYDTPETQEAEFKNLINKLLHASLDEQDIIREFYRELKEQEREDYLYVINLASHRAKELK